MEIILRLLIIRNNYSGHNRYLYNLYFLYNVYCYVIHKYCNFVWKIRGNPDDDLIKLKKTKKKTGKVEKMII